MNAELRKNAKNDFEKDIYKLMNNALFGKTMENVRKHKDNKLVTNNKKRCKVVSKPNYHTTKWFSDEFVAVEMNKLMYLGFSILEVSKILMYEFWYDYMKPKYGEKAKLCYTDTDCFTPILQQKIFIKIMHPMLINDLILLVI